MATPPDPLLELEALLAALPQGEDAAPLLSELDGFLAGTLIGPVPIARLRRRRSSRPRCDSRGRLRG